MTILTACLVSHRTAAKCLKVAHKPETSHTIRPPCSALQRWNLLLWEIIRATHGPLAPAHRPLACGIKACAALSSLSLLYFHLPFPKYRRLHSHCSSAHRTRCLRCRVTDPYDTAQERSVILTSFHSVVVSCLSVWHSSCICSPPVLRNVLPSPAFARVCIECPVYPNLLVTICFTSASSAFRMTQPLGQLYSTSRSACFNQST